MNGILLDNWSLEELTVEKDYKKSAAYYDFLEALVLWDDIYYPDNSYSYWWKKLLTDNSLKGLIKPLKDNENEFMEEASEIYNEISDNDIYGQIIGEGGIRCSLLSNSKGLDYFPSQRRRDFLDKIDQKTFYNKFLNRYTLTHALDSEVKRYYTELSAFLSAHEIRFELPLLAGYIIKNTPPDMSNIDYAVLLRKDKAVILYRQYLSRLEKALNKGELEDLFEYETALKELVRGIFKGGRDGVSLSCGLLISPSINLSLKKYDIEKYVHLSFLKRLVKSTVKSNSFIY